MISFLEKMKSLKWSEQKLTFRFIVVELNPRSLLLVERINEVIRRDLIKSSILVSISVSLNVFIFKYPHFVLKAFVFNYNLGIILSFFVD